jgi:Trypsin-co-occurring domain 2
MSDEPIQLATLIRELRRELLDAIKEGADSPLRFALGPVELDLEVQVTREAGGGGGVRFWVVSAEASAKTGSAHSQRIHVVLNPPRETMIGAPGKPE